MECLKQVGGPLSVNQIFLDGALIVALKEKERLAFELSVATEERDEAPAGVSKLQDRVVKYRGGELAELEDRVQLHLRGLGSSAGSLRCPGRVRR